MGVYPSQPPLLREGLILKIMKTLSGIISWFGRIYHTALRHKFWSAIVLMVLAYGGYYAYGKITTLPAETRYVLVPVERGIITSTVSGSGQVSVLNQLELKPKVSGTVLRVLKKAGDKVSTGELIATLDTTDAAKTVRDAAAGLASAQVSLAKTKEAADQLSITQSENDLASAKDAKQNAEDDLVKSYDDGFTSVAGTFIDLPGVMTGLDNLVNGNGVNSSQGNVYAYHDLIKDINPNADQFRDAAIASYNTARKAYDKNLQDYRNANRYSSRGVIDSLITETYDTSKSISQAIKDMKNVLDLVNDSLANSTIRAKPPAILATHEVSAQTYTSTVSGDLSNLLNVKNTIKNDNDTIVTSNRTITAKTQALDKLKAGADPLDIQSQQISVEQRQNALLDARQNLANYYIRAPFSGILATVGVNPGDPASSGTAIANIIAPQKVAEISLNEVDVAKVKMGQKATMTFDAIPDLTITGEIVQIDTVGTITQGVVNYTVQIKFDTDDDRVKPSMSVAVAILTNIKPDALYVPNSAVKSQGPLLVPNSTGESQVARSYVETLDPVLANATESATSSTGILSPTAPVKKTIQTGIVNDSYTEVVSGLKEGDLIITRTISTAASKTTTASSASALGGLRIPGLGGGGAGGGVRPTGAAATGR